MAMLDNEFIVGRTARRRRGTTGTAVSTQTLGTQQPETKPVTLPGLEPSASTTGIASTDPRTRPQLEQVRKTHLAEGDPFKLDPVNRIQYKSPKYSFLQKAPFYDYDQLDQLLGDLQGDQDMGRFWKGWVHDGRGNIKYTGSLADLAPEWGGVNWVDVVLGRTDGSRAWRWGVEAHGGPPRASDFASTSSSTSNDELTALLQKLVKQNSGVSGGIDPTNWPKQPAFDYQKFADTIAASQQQATRTPTVTGVPSQLALRSDGLSRAMQLLAMQMPNVLREVNDPLVRQLLSLYGS